MSNNGQLYCFKWYNASEERVQAAWFRWTMPGQIEYHFFSSNVLTLAVRSATSPNTLILVSLTIDNNNNSNGPLFFQGDQVDVRLDLHTYNPMVAYNSTNNTTEVGIPDHLADFQNQTWECATLGSATPGITFTGPLINTPANPVGRRWHLRIPGNLSSNRFAIGARYIPEATLPAFYVADKEGRRRDTRNVPIVHRLTLSSFDSGPYQVEVRSLGRNPFISTLEQKVTGANVPNTIPLVRNRTNTVPVMAKGDATEIKIKAPFLFPVAVNSVLWEGTYDTFGQKQV
jgi:hypothetical protein